MNISTESNPWSQILRLFPHFFMFPCFFIFKIIIIVLFFKGLRHADGSLRDIYVPAAQHDWISHDLRPVPTVEQHDAWGQHSSCIYTHERHTSSTHRVIKWSYILPAAMQKDHLRKTWRFHTCVTKDTFFFFFCYASALLLFSVNFTSSYPSFFLNSTDILNRINITLWSALWEFTPVVVVCMQMCVTGINLL